MAYKFPAEKKRYVVSFIFLQAYFEVYSIWMPKKILGICFKMSCFCPCI